MTTPTTGAALAILIAFVLPGFVAVRFQELTHDIREQQTSAFERLLQVVYYSAWVYGILAIVGLILRPFGWPVEYSRGKAERLVEGEEPGWLYLLLVALVLLIIPALIATVSRLWLSAPVMQRFRGWTLSKLAINPNHRTPTAWDHVFSPARELFALVTLRDGRVVGGTYERDSFAAYASTGGDLYLAARWSLGDDGWFRCPASGTAGLWLPRDSIVSIEFYDVPDAKEAATVDDSNPDGEEGRPPATILDPAGERASAETR